MHRLFVALRPPPPIRAALAALMEGVPGARWQDDEQLHLTLRFIGEVERPVAEDVAAALASVDHPRPSLALDGVGTFGRKGSVHTLWAGVAADPALGLLRQRVERAVVRTGLPPEARAFKPHVTLARFGRAAPPLDRFLARNATLASPPATLDAFLLYESRLGREGARYDAMMRYPLR